MSATILDAIQGVATPAMIQAATSILGLSESSATSALGAASTSILGGMIQKSADAAFMSKVTALVGGIAMDGGMFANMAGFLAGGIPASPAQLAGNRFLGLVFGDKSAAMMAAVASATGVSAKASSGLMTLAAPMVLAALRTKLGATPSAAGLASLLASDRNLIASAMPAQMRTIYGLTGAAPAPAPAAPVVAAPVVAAPAPAVAVKPAAPAPAPAPVAAPGSATAPRVTPVAQTESGYASAPAVMPDRPISAAAVRPVSEPAGMDAGEPARTSPLAVLALLIPLAVLAGLIWYWAYGIK